MADLSAKLSQRIKQLRQDNDYSLDDLAAKSGISRASLSRLEKGDVSPTAQMLGKLCAAYGLSMSRLLAMVEDQFAPIVRVNDQQIWRDDATGFVRKAVSPPNSALKGEVIECHLDAGQEISYEKSPVEGLEHHLVLRSGELEVQLGDQTFHLFAHDCLRYQLYGRSRFKTPDHAAATYLIFLV
ncbi:helix-turn-helix domain-containing protein [Maritalea sp.]|uniref:helix-turn-helix domain-containing protein n=1 Tax=Maritalea sp. TaxID=2003361 RepID=UPI0039E5EB50